MKKLFYIFAVLATTLNTAAWGDNDTKEINISWDLSIPNKNYNSIIGAQQLYVYDQNEECTVKIQPPVLNRKDFKTKSQHKGISSLTNLNTQGQTTLLCPKGLRNLTLVFDFNNGNGTTYQSIALANSANPASFTKTFDISKEKNLKIKDNIETVYEQQTRLIKEAKENFCIGNASKINNRTFCCTNGIKDDKTADLKDALDKIAGKNYFTIDASCQTAPTDTRNQANREYANSLRDDWQTAKAQPATQVPKTNNQTTTDGTETISISGTVIDDKNEPLPGANIVVIDPNGNNTSIGTSTDFDGNFTLSNIQKNARLKISFIGYKAEIISADKINGNRTIKLTSDTLLSDVQIDQCSPTSSEHPGALERALASNNKCVPSKCDEPRYKLTGQDTTATCTEQKCEIENGSGKWSGEQKNWKCIVVNCKSGYKPNDEDTACMEMLKNCTEQDQKKLEATGASETGLRKGTETCIATDCKCGYTLTGENCDPWGKDQNGKYTKPCEKSELEKLNAKSGILACNDKDKAFCEITECISSEYTHNTEKNTCDSKNKQPCDPIPENATDAEYKRVDGKLVCIINKCADGYERDADKTKCNPRPKLSEEDSLKKIDELQQNADAMREKEQSTANKLLGGATMAATGIGGMQAMSAISEQNADEDAEQAMRAYLATFHCNYGGGMNIPGGEKNIELPGGNELIGLYSEYVNLANDLKVRKTALDMRPGIESEPILDAATSGLYDDVAIGKTSGAYTSLARALMDPNGPDAAAWAEQKAETADKKKTGMITAGIGAAGSLVGNLAINSGKAKQNKLDEILNKYDKKKQLLDDLQSDVATIPPQTATCPDGTTGTAHPDCTCTDTTQIYNPNTHACEQCVGGQTVQNGKCECPTDKPLWDNRISQCVAEPTTCTPQCTPTYGDHLIVQNNCSCTCNDGYTYENGTCTCVGENKQIGADGTCKTIETKTIVERISTLTTTTVENASLPAGSLFKVGSYKLVDAAKTALNTFIKGLSDAGYTNCKITIDGYTDPLGGTETNKTLSQNRANAVKQYIKDLNNSAIESVPAVGYGETKCTCGAGKQATDTDSTINGITINYSDREYSACKDKTKNYSLSGDTRYAPCRRVEISADCKYSTTTTQTVSM